MRSAQQQSVSTGRTYDHRSTVFITAGRKAAQFVARTPRARRRFSVWGYAAIREARAIAAMARDLFVKGEVDEVILVATRFINTLTQRRSPSSICRSAKSRA